MSTTTPTTPFASSSSNNKDEENSGATASNPIAAIAQLRSTSDKFQNLVNIAFCAGLAKSKGASMLFLPECFGFMGESALQTLQEAESLSRLSTLPLVPMPMNSSPTDDDTPKREEEKVLANILKSTIHGAANCSTGVDGDTADRYNGDLHDAHKMLPVVHSLMDGLRIIAKESGLWISGGGIHVSGAPPEGNDDGKQLDSSEASALGVQAQQQQQQQQRKQQQRVYNTHVILDSDGKLKASYQKIHLFDVSIPGKVELRESKTTAPGENLVVCDSPLGKLGVTTCYDLRFPEMYTELVGSMGAQILLVPSAFTVPTGAAHWHVLLRARAIENQCYVLAAAQYGKHNQKRESFGHSLAVDPWGKILADAGGYPTTEEEANPHDRKTPEPPSIITAEIDLSLIDSIRQRMPIDLHRSNAKF